MVNTVEDEKKELSEEEMLEIKIEEENALLDLVDTLSIDELREMNSDTLMDIMNTLQFPINMQTFFFAKNIKIFGGINEYVNDFLPKIQSMNQRERLGASLGAILLLHKMLNHPNLTHDNRIRILSVIEEISPRREGSRSKKLKSKLKLKKSRKNSKRKQH